MLLAASRCRHGSAASVDSVASPSTRRQDERVTGGGVVPRCRAALERCIWHLKRGLAGFGISANHAYLRAERKVHEWREEYPLSTRWLLDVPFGLFSLAFFYFDLISDLLVVAALARSGLGAWAGASATILVVQYLVTHLSVLAYLRRSHGVRADVLCAAGVLAFPIGVLLLDLAMFLEPLTLLRELSSLGCANADRLQLFLPSCRHRVRAVTSSQTVVDPRGRVCAVVLVLAHVPKRPLVLVRTIAFLDGALSCACACAARTFATLQTEFAALSVPVYLRVRANIRRLGVNTRGARL
eukprot:5657562-Pleurochrysis_carterae.AAC.1